MFVIFIHGPVSSGKYTIAKELARLTDLPLFHNHLTVDLVTSLFEFGTPPFVALRERLWLAAFAEAAGAGRSFIFTFNPEATVNSDFIDKTLATINSAGGTIRFIEVTCSEEVIESRIEDKSRASFGKLNSIDFYRQLRAEGAFEYPPLPEPFLTVDSGALSPLEAATAIQRGLSEAA